MIHDIQELSWFEIKVWYHFKKISSAGKFVLKTNTIKSEMGRWNHYFLSANQSTLAIGFSCRNLSTQIYRLVPIISRINCFDHLAMTHAIHYVDKLILSQKLISIYKRCLTIIWKWSPEYSHNRIDDMECNSRYYAWDRLGWTFMLINLYIIFALRFGIQHQVTLPGHEGLIIWANSNSDLMTIFELQLFWNLKLLPSMATKCVSFTR